MKHQLNHLGYLFDAGEHNSLHQHLTQYCGNAYARFRQSWSQLCLDPYLRDGGSYRKRRYSVFTWRKGELDLLPHEPHYQSNFYNVVHGGFNRHFRPWLDTTIQNPAFKIIIQWAMATVGAKPTQKWRIQAHQFRIEASQLEQGKPTPEGVHKDGADYILIMLMDRHNVSGGESHIFDNDMQPLAEQTLEQAGDLALINDEKVYHGVTPIHREEADKAAWRDVMVLTFHKQL